MSEISPGRRALLKRHARYFAAGLVENCEAVASGQFEFLNLSHEEAELIHEEMQAIGRRISKGVSVDRPSKAKQVEKDQ